MDVEAFKNDCLNLQHDVVVQKYLIDGSCYFFDIEDSADEFLFKKDIANSLEVHIRDIVIVGSGKLGFSIKPDKDVPSYFPYKVFDEDYNKQLKNKKSDLDVAIVSNSLFDKQLIGLYLHTNKYSDRQIWNRTTDRNSLAKYVLKGWIKPDFIPREYKISNRITEIQHKYKMQLGRDINIGIYKNWFFFEDYHINNIRNIHLNIIGNE